MKMFQKIYSSDGRIRRTEYGISLLGSVLLFLVTQYILVDWHMEVASYFAWTPYLVFILSQGAKRCHDIGKRGWMQFVPLYIFWMIFEDGEPGFNQFGENPKGFGNFELEALTDKQEEE